MYVGRALLVRGQAMLVPARTNGGGSRRSGGRLGRGGAVRSRKTLAAQGVSLCAEKPGRPSSSQPLTLLIIPRFFVLSTGCGGKISAPCRGKPNCTGENPRCTGENQYCTGENPRRTGYRARQAPRKRRRIRPSQPPDAAPGFRKGSVRKARRRYPGRLRR